jgi:hypothetical protein
MEYALERSLSYAWYGMKVKLVKTYFEALRWHVILSDMVLVMGSM